MFVTNVSLITVVFVKRNSVKKEIFAEAVLKVCSFKKNLPTPTKLMSCHPTPPLRVCLYPFAFECTIIWNV